MHKFSITFTDAPGEVIVTYDADAVLRIFDATNATITAQQIHWLKNNMPMILAKQNLEAFITAAKNKITITQTSFDVSFELFWTTYNRKFNKKRTQALYNKLSYTKKLKCIDSIKDYDNFLKNQKFDRAKLDADTYLRNEAWENDWKNG